jgi:Ca2+-binding RTX toxin-like protein
VSGTVIQPQAPVAAVGEIVGVTFQNAGAGTLAAGIATFGQAFVAGDLPAGSTLMARIGATLVPVQVDAKTFHPDGSVSFAVLSLARPALAAGESLQVLLRPAEATAAPAINLDTALAGRSFVVEITPQGGATQSIDVLAVLRDAVAKGTASYWQQGPFATEARVSVDLPGSQRLVFDVTAYAGGGYSVQAQFNNDEAMGPTGGTVTYTAVVRMDGREVDRQSVTQAQYQNWRELYASNETDGGQGIGAPTRGWLNIQHDIPYLQETGAIARYDLDFGIAETKLAGWATQMQSASWGQPLSANGVTQYMPMTGGRDDLGITTAANTAWLISQDARVAAFALGQAEAATAVPWNFWDAANGTWLNTDNYPRLWTDGRGGTGTPGNPNSGGLTQQISNSTGWSPDNAHQPDLSFVPYLLTGDRAILDTVYAQASFSIMGLWPHIRLQGEGIVVNGDQVRSSAWALRQVQNAAWAAPEGSAEQAYFQEIADRNWAWLVEQIPSWTAMQGEAHGWLPGVYGTPGALAPWQQDYFASTAIAAASRGNTDAMTFLQWQTNFLVGRFMQGQNGFAPHDGAAYNIAISPTNSNQPYTSWAEIGAATVARGMSNGTGWSQSVGEYARLAGSTLAGIYLLTGNEDALKAFRMLVNDGAPEMSARWYEIAPQYALSLVDELSGVVKGTAGDEVMERSAAGGVLDIDLGAGKDVLALGPGNDMAMVRNAETVLGGAGNDAVTVIGAEGGTFVDLGSGTDTLSLLGGTVTVTGAERIVGLGMADDVVLMDRLVADSPVVDLGAGADRLRLANGANTVTVANVETVLGGTGRDDVTVLAASPGSLFDLGAGLDVLRLSGSGSLSVRAAGVETVLGGAANESVTLLTAITDGLVSLGAGSDTLQLGNFANKALVEGVETILGGTGADWVILQSAALPGTLVDLGAGNDTLRLGVFNNTVTVRNVETIIGSGLADVVTLGTVADGTVVSLGVGQDRLNLANGANRVRATLVETVIGGTGADDVTFGAATALASFVDLGGGVDILRLANGANTLTVANVETVLGGTGRDDVTVLAASPGSLFDLGAGLDVLRLAGSGSLSVRAAGVETVLGGAANESVTLLTAITDGLVSLGAGSDTLQLGNFANKALVEGVETILGGTGADWVILQSAALPGTLVDLGAGNDTLRLGVFNNTVTVRNVETIIGSGLADVVTLGTVADGTVVSLGAGQDRLSLANGTNRVTATLVETVIGGTGADDVTFGTATMLASFVDLGAGADILRLANGANTVTVANVETVLGGSGEDRISVTGSVGARIEGRGGSDVIAGGAGADTIIGGTGADTMSGGGGADWFIFEAGDSSLSNPDVILDFMAAQGDRLIVAGRDMRDYVARGEAVFAPGGGPQMRFIEATGRAEFDIDGNGTADLAIILQAGMTSALRQAPGDFA